MSDDNRSGVGPEYAALAETFQPLFATIREGALARERDRQLPHAEVASLARAGFGALRIPRRYGGAGASMRQLFRLLVELGEADSNLVQIFRAHFGFVETLLQRPEGPARDEWFERIVAGAFVGAAMSEKTAVGNLTMQLVQKDDRQWLSGEKYYTTGTLYADWIHLLAVQGEEIVVIVIPKQTDGITVIDDWDGFGQRMTASGTVRFDGVAVTSGQLIHRTTVEKLLKEDTYLLAFYQQVHLATLAGIGRAALRDVVDFVKGRTRVVFVPGTSKPQTDPLVQSVVGRLSSLSFVLDSIVDGVSERLDAAHERAISGRTETDDAIFQAADLAAYQGQQVAIDLVLKQTSQLFEVGGASALSVERQLDRHWRNARTVASHNPAIQRARIIGDYRLNGVSPRAHFSRATPDKAVTEKGPAETQS